jgi:hypothetical protein
VALLRAILCVVAQTRAVVVALCVLAVLALFAVSNEYLARREAHARGIAACVTAGHDEGTCAEAAERNDTECFPESYRPPGRWTARRFDAEGYATCIDQGAQAYDKARAARAEDGRRRRAQSAAAMP